MGFRRRTMKPGRSGRSRLTPRQEMCLLLLLGGMSQAAAARALGLHPNTIYRWVNRDHLFQSFYRERLQHVWDWQRNEVSLVLRKVMDSSLELISRSDLSSIEKGVRLFAEAMRKIPPYFLPCPGDIAEGGCPHIPGQRMSPLQIYKLALQNYEILPDEMSEEEYRKSVTRRMELLGQIACGLGDAPHS
jgi:transposase